METVTRNVIADPGTRYFIFTELIAACSWVAFFVALFRDSFRRPFVESGGPEARSGARSPNLGRPTRPFLAPSAFRHA